MIHQTPPDAAPDGGTPVRLDMAPIIAIHRGHDGHVSFRATSRSGANRELGSVVAADLEAPRPPADLEAALAEDATFSVNGFYKRPRRRVTRAGEDLRYLCACYVDLDGYNAGLTADQVADRLFAAVDRGDVPWPSITAKSGRGVWAFWIIEDARRPGHPDQAHPPVVARYRRIQQALKQRLREICPDALDASRTARVPGSINTKVGRSAIYTIHADAAGASRSYTLRELCRLLDVPEPGEARQRRQAVAATDSKRSAAGRAGFNGRCRLRLDRLLLLERLRGGFAMGCRNRAALLAHHFANTHPDDLDVDEVVEGLADRCRPALDVHGRKDAALFAATMSVGKRTITNQTIADWLDVSPGEAEDLRHQLGGRTPWPAASRFGGQSASAAIAAAKPTRAVTAEARRRMIRQILAGREDGVPSTREMARLLDDHGHTASHATVAGDYRRLGVAA